VNVEKGDKGTKASLDFLNCRKKVVFLVLCGKKQISPLLAPLQSCF